MRPAPRRPGGIGAVAAPPAESRAADGMGRGRWAYFEHGTPVLAVRSGRVALHRAFMAGNHRDEASHRLMRNFKFKEVTTQIACI